MEYGLKVGDLVRVPQIYPVAQPNHPYLCVVTHCRAMLQVTVLSDNWPAKHPRDRWMVNEAGTRRVLVDQLTDDELRWYTTWKMTGEPIL